MCLDWLDFDGNSYSDSDSGLSNSLMILDPALETPVIPGM